MTRPEHMDMSRRQFITRLGSNLAVGGVIAGAALYPPLRESVLDAGSRLNDGFQAGLFSGHRLARDYAPGDITNPFPYNGFLPEAYVPQIRASEWGLDLKGRLSTSARLSLDDIHKLEKHAQTTRLICIEGWSAVGHWAGARLSDVLTMAGADFTSKYVVFQCADGYSTSIDMASALHPQSILAYEFLGRPLAPAFGAPLRLRIPTKLGFKNAKFLLSIEVTNRFAGGYWEDQGYNWFAGL